MEDWGSHQPCRQAESVVVLLFQWHLSGTMPGFMSQWFITNVEHLSAPQNSHPVLTILAEKKVIKKKIINLPENFVLDCFFFSYFKDNSHIQGWGMRQLQFEWKIKVEVSKSFAKWNCCPAHSFNHSRTIFFSIVP